MKCNQANCPNDGAYRFTWPGQKEAHICEEHVAKLRGVANAMGLPLQIIPLTPAEVVGPSFEGR